MTALLYLCFDRSRRNPRTARDAAALEATVEALVSEATQLAHGHADGAFFRRYANLQIQKSFKATLGLRGALLSDRTERLVGLMDKVLPKHRARLSVLCVGCRNTQELVYIKRTCRVGCVRGLDLFSVDPSIQVGDMHAMPFADGSFDVVYTCHSLEHAYDLPRALRECIRVAIPRGLLVIEMPVRFPVSSTDLCDVGSSSRLLGYLGNVVDEVLLREDSPDVLRLIVRVTGSKRNEDATHIDVND